ncbi:TIGR01244 family sulfur transferase [Kordiimonas sp.]|uniref:TIGR01244 family sulfur transferase n=1 Tax=Kordiimonas sp. TaxID=1970157 RepID=UPI003A8FAAD6
MDIRKITPGLSVSSQITVKDISILAGKGFKGIINVRPDSEEDGQPGSEAIADAAREFGLAYRHIPIVPGKMTDADIEAFRLARDEMVGPVLSFCRTGTRAITLWACTKAPHLSTEAIIETAAAAGYDLSGKAAELDARRDITSGVAVEAFAQKPQVHDVVIVGGGAGGLAAAASLLKRRPGLDITVIEPRDTHYYQPGWTLVGGGVFSRDQTKRAMADVMPAGVKWTRAAVAHFEPEKNAVVLESGDRVFYRSLVVAPGIKLDWDRVDGLREALGSNGVTSNYQFDLAPYTWELVKTMKKGKALFTQPPMPIKCAGAPQKAMYLACDHWRRTGALADIDVAFHTAGAVLFGVKEYVPELMRYVERYGAELCFQENLLAIDGPAKLATFEVTGADGSKSLVERPFDIIHVCPPQGPQDFMRGSPLVDEAGWVDVSSETLQHSRYGNVFGIGDGCSAPNAKTAAAVRKQAPVVAHNIISVLEGGNTGALYEGYGSCPLTVERGRVVLAEFGYGGALQPTFPKWLVNPVKASGLAWFLKEKLMPALYFDLMLKGREWLAKPEVISHSPLSHEVETACDFSGEKTS